MQCGALEGTFLHVKLRGNRSEALLSITTPAPRPDSELVLCVQTDFTSELAFETDTNGMYVMRRSFAHPDTLARNVISPQQLPVGVITALVGVPVFLVLLSRGVAR